MSYDIQYYDEDPNKSVKPSGGSKFYQEAQVNRIKFASKFINKHSTVADICCGSGFASTHLQYKHYYGVDHPEMVNLIQDKFKYAGKSVSFLPYDFEEVNRNFRLPESVNFIISFETLEHTTMPEKLVNDFRSNLKKGGTLILSTPCNPFGYPPMSIEHIKEYSIDEVSELLQKEGFEIRSKHAMGFPVGALLRTKSLKTNRFDPSKEERGRISRLSDKLGFLRRVMNKIIPYKPFGIPFGHFGTNLIIVAQAP